MFATTNKYGSLDPALCRPGRMDIHVEFMLASKFQTRELFKRFYVPRKSTEDEPEEDEGDSGYASSSASDVSESAPLISESSSAVKFVGSRHRSNEAKLSRRRVEKLADTFAELIPERQFSMASLQGYLMTHKMRPVAAVDGAVAWAEKELADRASRSAGKS